MRRISRRILAASAASALALLGVGLIAAPANAADVVVDSTADDGSGGTTLREAVAASNPGDTIVFDPTVFSTPQTINLIGSAVIIPHTLTIEGPGQDLLTIQRDSDAFVFALFQVLPPVGVLDPVDVTLSGLTLNKDAGETNTVLGTAFLATSSSILRDLTVTDVDVTNQDSQDSGGAFSVEMTGDAEFTRVELLSNTSAFAGGAVWIYNAASVEFTDADIIGNSAGTYGGGVALEGVDGEISFDGADVAGNAAEQIGGGVYVDTIGARLDATFSVFADNIADGPGGGIHVGTNNGALEIHASLFDDNAGATGAGLYVDDTNNLVSITNSTFAGGSADRGLAIGIGTLNATFQLVSSTIDTFGTDEYAIYVGTAVQDGLPEAHLSLNYSTVVGPGVLWIESNSADDANLWHTIADGSGLDAVRVDDGDPVDAYWSLISSAANADIDPVEGVTFGVTDMGLAQLADNGGPTPTRMLLPGSPAYNGGNPGILSTPDWDQRLEGFPRVIAGIIDVGAIEAPEEQPVLPATGSTVPMWIPIVGGVVLLLGAAAVVFTIVSRRRLAADAPATPPASSDEPETPPSA